MGAPLAPWFSASKTSRGKLTNAAPGRAGPELTRARGEFGVFVSDWSFELQLEAPNIASSASTINIDASRSGVQNLTSLSTFCLSDI
jgi:hypothetical protein